MGLETILKMAGGLGPTISLLVLVLSVGVGLGILVFNMRHLARAIESQSSAFNAQMNEARERSDERDQRIEELLTKQDVRITYIETRYATKEDLYSVAGGWRQEYLHLNQRIDQIRDSKKEQP